MTNRYYVYQYIRPDTLQPFYIGKGTGNRYKQHLSDKPNYCANKRMNGTVRNYITAGTPPIIEIIQNDMTNEDALQLESELVELHGRRGIDDGGILMNILEGGLDTPMFTKEEHPWYGRKHTDESKQKMSDTLKKRYKDNPELHGFTGCHHTAESKARISKAKTGHKFTPEQCKSMALARTGWKQTEHQKQAVTKANSHDWILTNPDGDEIHVNNLRKWCREMGLDQGNLVKVSQGKLHHSKGWKCCKM